MAKLLSLVILTLGLCGLAFGQHSGQTAPEIDPGQAVTALALLSGGMLVIRGRRKA